MPELHQSNLRRIFVTASAGILDVDDVIAVERHHVGVSWRCDFHLRSGVVVSSWHASQKAAKDKQVAIVELMQGKPTRATDPNPPADPSLN